MKLTILMIFLAIDNGIMQKTFNIGNFFFFNNFEIGVINGVSSIDWQNLRHAIDEWNNLQSSLSQNSKMLLNLIAPSDTFASIDNRFCNILQHRLIAVVLNTQENISRDELLLVLSMCNQFQIPCIIDRKLSFIKGIFLLN